MRFDKLYIYPFPGVSENAHCTDRDSEMAIGKFGVTKIEDFSYKLFLSVD